jgi:hypothetical protein
MRSRPGGSRYYARSNDRTTDDRALVVLPCTRDLSLAAKHLLLDASRGRSLVTTLLPSTLWRSGPKTHLPQQIKPYHHGLGVRPAYDVVKFTFRERRLIELNSLLLIFRGMMKVNLVAHDILHPSSADHSIAGAATLAHHSRWLCEPIHRRHLNRTFRDGHHNRRWRSPIGPDRRRTL